MNSFASSLLLFAVSSNAISIEGSSSQETDLTRVRDTFIENKENFSFESILDALNL